MTSTIPSTTHALKEWQVAIQALETGAQVLLLRKGGIRETGGKFTVEHERVLLYPTYEHQQPRFLKPEYADRVEPVASGWHPETVRIGSWAMITEIFQVTNAERVADLSLYHIWTAEFIADRLKWKPSQPLYVLLLRTYRLNQPQLINYSPTYSGCRSWIDLLTPIDLNDSQVVVSDREYALQIERIRAIVGS
ncbi:DUF1802 family protein [Pantanalinema sp. GBBB05]|uniref:DUF1802 family protein n=1 Tax=Pantanalinema sp. GBBB05 TaxID=2604139 RepID=UPI003D81B606